MLGSRPKTPFGVPGKGLYKFCVMPLGLVHSIKTMVRHMDIVLNPATIPYCCVFLDDNIVATPTFQLILKIIKEANLKSCELCTPSLKFVGFVNTDPDKFRPI